MINKKQNLPLPRRDLTVLIIGLVLVLSVAGYAGWLNIKSTEKINSLQSRIDEVVAEKSSLINEKKDLEARIMANQQTNEKLLRQINELQGESAEVGKVGVDEIDTSEWLTYRNEEYGFEVKYPKKWIYNEIKNPQITQSSIVIDFYNYEEEKLLREQSTAELSSIISINIFDNLNEIEKVYLLKGKKSENLEQFVDKSSLQYYLAKGKRLVQFNSISGFQIVDEGLSSYLITFFEEDSKIFRFSSDEKMRNEHEAMLNTVKFD